MIPTPEQLEEISRLPGGNLHDVPFPVILTALAVHRQTAVLELTRRQVSKTVVLEAGVPVDCRSNLVHETLGRFMAAAGKLGEDEAHSFFGQAAARGIPLGVVLIENERVTPEELHRLLQQNLAKKLLDLFTWQEGEYRLQPAASGSALGLKLKVPQLILTGVTKLLPQEEVDAAVVPLVGKKLALHPTPLFPLEELRLAPHQSQAVLALRTGWRIDELALGTGLPFEELTRLLYALSVLGVVVTADRLPKGAALPPLSGALSLPVPPPIPQSAPAPAPSSAPAPPPVPQAPAPSAAELEGRRNEVMQAFLRLGKQDAFDLLGVPEEAGRQEIDACFLALAQRYAPWSLPAGLEGLEEKARTLFLALARAYSEISDADQRQTLLFRRKTLREEREKKPVDWSIKTDLLDPRAQFRKGIALREAGKLREAVMQLEFAADCDPQNGLYGAELVYTRYLFSPNSAGRLVKDLAEVLRMDPECGLAHYYDGELQRHLGHYTEAEASYRRAIKLMSPDRRPIDALKTLAGEKKK